MSPTPDDVRVRPAVPADAADIAHVHVTTWQQAYDGILPVELLDTLSVELRTRRWAEFLDAVPDRNSLLLARVGDRTVGFVGVCPSRDADVEPGTGEVAAIYLLRPWWDRGIGATLLDAAEAALVDHGFDEATLWVLADNVRARTFYERRGWVVDGGERTEDHHGRLVRVVRYWRTLARPSDDSPSDDSADDNNADDNNADESGAATDGRTTPEG